MAEADLVQKLCLNKSCGQKYTEKENYDGSCRHHPGFPVFHEGLKGWSCCDKKFSDFTDFLNYPGCTTGRHSDEKPPEPEVKDEPAVKEEMRKPLDKDARVRSMETMTDIPVKVSASLTSALASAQEVQKQEEESQEVKEGQSCTNNTCKHTYASPKSNEETCVFHPGSPVFHEGMKYWSCCDRKKTHDFDEFLAMPGCTEGKHRWFKPKEEQLKAKQCRYEWFQTGDHIVLSVFAKLITPDNSSFKANKDSLQIKLCYDSVHTFDLELHLAADIVPTECIVNLNSAKADIKLKKAESTQWSDLTPKVSV